MKLSTGTVSLVLVITAVSSLISMISLLRIDSIVHGLLYGYGLRFSYQWAVPYWTMTTLIFGMGWFNIIVAIAFEFYLLVYGRKEVTKPEVSQWSQTQPTGRETAQGAAEPSLTEEAEEPKQQATEQATQSTETIEMKPEEDQAVVEPASQSEQTEPGPTAQDQESEPKEQEPQPAEEAQSETQETSPTQTETETTTVTEAEQKTPKKSDEAPILVGVPEEQP
jgi:hypothetical protein